MTSAEQTDARMAAYRAEIDARFDYSNWRASVYGPPPSDAMCDVAARLLMLTRDRRIKREMLYSMTAEGIGIVSPDWNAWFDDDSSLALVVLRPAPGATDVRLAIWRDADDAMWFCDGIEEALYLFEQAIQPRSDTHESHG